jgi:hypothetical protein
MHTVLNNNFSTCKFLFYINVIFYLHHKFIYLCNKDTLNDMSICAFLYVNLANINIDMYLPIQFQFPFIHKYLPMLLNLIYKKTFFFNN